MNSYLQNLQPMKVNITINPPKGSSSTVRPIQMSYVYPPANTNIDLSSLKVYKRSEISGVFKAKDVVLPEFFSWSPPNENGVELFRSHGDSESVKIIKRKITKPSSQGICGSCWAISTCGIVSDLFVISGITDVNPEISATSLMACNKGPIEQSGNAQCDGGLPAYAATFISKNGINSDKCIDYSWCLKNDKCSGMKSDGGSEFDQKVLYQHVDVIMIMNIIIIK